MYCICTKHLCIIIIMQHNYNDTQLVTILHYLYDMRMHMYMYIYIYMYRSIDLIDLYIYVYI